MLPTAILATPGGGIARAERQPGGNWLVTRLADDHKVYCLASAAGGQMLYAGSDKGALRSTDAGRSWQAMPSAPPNVNALAVSPHDANVIIAGVRPAGVHISRDGGAAWEASEAFQRIPNRWWWFSPAEPPDRRPYVFAVSISPTFSPTA